MTFLKIALSHVIDDIIDKNRFDVFLLVTLLNLLLAQTLGTLRDLSSEHTRFQIVHHSLKLTKKMAIDDDISNVGLT